MPPVDPMSPADDAAMLDIVRTIGRLREDYNIIQLQWINADAFSVAVAHADGATVITLRRAPQQRNGG